MKPFFLKPSLVDCLRGYTGKKFMGDLIAGIIVAVIALPLSIALALASGASPRAGVYTAIFAGFAVSLLGGSPVQIAGPTAAFAVIVAKIIGEKGMEGLILSTLIASVLLILMGVFRLGGLIRFVPETITVGFTSGIAVTIFLGQIKDFLGLSYPEGTVAVETLEKIKANVSSLSTFSWQALLVGAVSLAILIFYPKVEKKIPPSLIAVVLSIVAVKFIPFLGDGVLTIGELYSVPSGLPPFALGEVSFSASKVLSAIPDGVTIALLAGIESLLSCVVADSMILSKHNPNAELVAQGFGNALSVMFGGIPATGAIARTAANVKNGGRTPVAGMVHALVLFLVILFLMPLAALIPMPTVAAILFVVAYNMSEWRKFRSLLKTEKKSAVLVLLLTFFLTVIFDLVVAIAVGLSLTFLLFLWTKKKKA